MGSSERAKGARTFMLALLASACALQPSLALAQSQSEPGQFNFDLPAQPLAQSLNDYARQTGSQVLFSYDELRGRQAPALRGAYDADEALRLLLAGSGLEAARGSDGVVRVADTSSPQQVNTADEAETEIVVTGTRIRGAPPAGSNVIGLDREDIEESGRTTLQDVLQTLPQVFTGSQSEGTQTTSLAPGRNITFASTVDLRGLGADATLTLVDGRRLAPSGQGNFVDISSIPLAAIERVEVLADGASAVYGADAVGGVVNIMLRRNLEADETRVRYGFADRTDEFNFSHVLGESWNGFSVVAGYEYRERGALEASERAYTASTDLTAFGGTNFSRNTSNPGNIIRVGATPVSYAIPTGQNGLTLTAAQLLPGQVNLQNGLQDGYLLPDQESQSAFITLRADPSSRVELFFDLLAAEREAFNARPQVGTTLTVPQTNYYRQQNGLFAGQGNLVVAYHFGDDFGPLTSATSSQSIAVATGARVDLFADWRLEASFAFSRLADEVDNGAIPDSAAINAALASSDPNRAFNVFGDGSHTPASVLAGLDAGQHVETDSELGAGALRFDGGLFELPGGRARMAFGVERRRETFEFDREEISAAGVVTRPFSQAPGRRIVDSYYGELYLPLLDADDGVALVDELTLSLSTRHEESSDFGDADTPRVGLLWALNPDLALRASWGTSFKAPQFVQLLGGIGATIGSLPASLDPAATNGSTGVLQLLGANRTLQPEEAETWTAGFDFHPRWAEDLRLTATYFDIDFTNRISAPGSLLLALQDPAAYQGYFIRNPTAQQIADYLALATSTSGTVPPDGIEVIWDERLTNLAALRVRGVDLSASYAFDTPLGDFSLFVSASGLLQYDRQSNPSLPAVNALDTFNNPVDWRARAGASLDTGQWRGALALSYVDDYRDNVSVPKREIDEWLTWDLSLSRRFGEDGDTELTLDVRNLTDEDPPFANSPNGYGYDALNGSPLGRMIAFSVRQRW